VDLWFLFFYPNLVVSVWVIPVCYMFPFLSTIFIIMLDIYLLLLVVGFVFFFVEGWFVFFFVVHWYSSCFFIVIFRDRVIAEGVIPRQLLCSVWGLVAHRCQIGHLNSLFLVSSYSVPMLNFGLVANPGIRACGSICWFLRNKIVLDFVWFFFFLVFVLLSFAFVLSVFSVVGCLLLLIFLLFLVAQFYECVVVTLFVSSLFWMWGRGVVWCHHPLCAHLCGGFCIDFFLCFFGGSLRCMSWFFFIWMIPIDFTPSCYNSGSYGILTRLWPEPVPNTLFSKLLLPRRCKTRLRSVFWLTLIELDRSASIVSLPHMSHISRVWACVLVGRYVATIMGQYFCLSVVSVTSCFLC